MRTRDLKKQAKMFAMIEAWRKSNLSQRAWCIQENLSLSKFKYWQKIYEDSQVQSQGVFIEMTSPSIKNLDQRILTTICYPNGVRLELDAASSNPSFLKSLITIF